MELLDRYLQAVRFWLPKAQQQDIIRELSEDLRLQIEDKEAGLGRKLNERELEALLVERGRPIVVAGRYLPEQYLIGPAFLRLYRFALKWVLLPVLIVFASPIGILTPLNPPPALTLTFWLVWRTVIYSFGIFTVVLALQEKLRGRTPAGWTPGYLRSVDHYLYWVKVFLPKEQQQDIIEELSEDIRSRIEDQEATLGRKLNKAELAAELRKRGHPVSLTERYLPQEYLIGPAWYPIYRFVLKAALLVVAPVILVIVGPLKVLSDAVTFRAVAETLAELWNATMYTVGLLTLLFAMLEHLQVKFDFLERWKPRALPPAVGRTRPIPRPQPVSGLVFWIVISLWWLAVPRFPYLLFGAAAANLKFAPAWQTFHLPILLLALAVTAHRAINVARPQWSWFLLAMRIVLNLTGAVILLLFMWTYPFVVSAGAAKDTAHYDYLAQFFSAAILFGVLCWTWPWMVVAAVVYAWQCLQYLRRLIRGQRDQAPLQSS